MILTLLGFAYGRVLEMQTGRYGENVGGDLRKTWSCTGIVYFFSISYMPKTTVHVSAYEFIFLLSLPRPASVTYNKCKKRLVVEVLLAQHKDTTYSAAFKLSAPTIPSSILPRMKNNISINFPRRGCHIEQNDLLMVCLLLYDSAC